MQSIPRDNAENPSMGGLDEMVGKPGVMRHHKQWFPANPPARQGAKIARSNPRHESCSFTCVRFLPDRKTFFT
jgi:hypothetical protein